MEQGQTNELPTGSFSIHQDITHWTTLVWSERVRKFSGGSLRPGHIKCLAPTWAYHSRFTFSRLIDINLYRFKQKWACPGTGSSDGILLCMRFPPSLYLHRYPLKTPNLSLQMDLTDEEYFSMQLDSYSSQGPQYQHHTGNFLTLTTTSKLGDPWSLNSRA